MKFINIVLASLIESAMAYTYYRNGAPADIYWFADKPLDKNTPLCDCEIFCAQHATCTYFVTGTTTCYAYNSATSVGW